MSRHLNFSSRLESHETGNDNECSPSNSSRTRHLAENQKPPYWTPQYSRVFKWSDSTNLSDPIGLCQEQCTNGCNDSAAAHKCKVNGRGQLPRTHQEIQAGVICMIDTSKSQNCGSKSCSCQEHYVLIERHH